MNQKKLAETLRAAAEKIEAGGWSDEDHLALVGVAQQSSMFEMNGGIPAPNILTRERWNQLSVRDQAAFFKGGGRLIDGPEIGGSK